MSGGSWPFLSGQCPYCFYFEPEQLPFTDDSGYEILGFCRHPRIGMELFRPQRLDVARADPCRLFVRRVGNRPDTARPGHADLG